MDHSREAVAARPRVPWGWGLASESCTCSFMPQLEAGHEPRSRTAELHPRPCKAGGEFGPLLGVSCPRFSPGPELIPNHRGPSLLPPPPPKTRSPAAWPFHRFSLLDPGSGDLPSLSNDDFSFSFKKKLIRDIPAANGGLIGRDNQRAHTAVIGFQPRARKLDILDSLEMEDFRSACGNTRASSRDPRLLLCSSPTVGGQLRPSSLSSGESCPLGRAQSPFPLRPSRKLPEPPLTLTLRR